ncbi:MAG: DUF1614 domain-containing protein [Candidatus Thermoplasmatota archaeon]|nr:DUF1614 domain-containing protein [Candidatus Thermoplasmatota archaeon]
MRSNRVLALPIAMLFLLFLFAIVLIFSLVISSAFRALGFSPFVTITIFFLALLGSTVNIPLYSKETKQPVRSVPDNPLMNFLYPDRRGNREKMYEIVETTVSINLGGAVIPILVSVYLVSAHPDLWIQFIVGILVVSSISYRFSKIIPNVGISLPLFIPPIIAALIAIILPGPDTILAFVSGVTGVLIGADVMNLTKIDKLQSKMMSIGGAGTFDGIFLTGIVSVLIAAI